MGGRTVVSPTRPRKTATPTEHAPCSRFPARPFRGNIRPARKLTGRTPRLPHSHASGDLLDELWPRLLAPLLRGAETVLPAPLYRAALYASAYLRAYNHRLRAHPPDFTWPSGLGGPQSPPTPALPRLPLYLNRTFEYLPDRLARPQWRACCRYVGLDPLQAAVSAGQPVILGFFHVGPFELLRNWLRAVGIPVTSFVGGQSRARPRLKRLKDRWALFPDIPLTFYQDQLPAAIAHLKSGRTLAMALDGIGGRQMQLPLPDGWTFQFATGPFRLARQHHALLMPCNIYNESPWHLTLEISPPLDPALLAAGDEPAAAAILAHLWPQFLAHPHDWTPQLAARVSRTSDSPALAEKDHP
jgi:hypothetical protein